MEFNFNVNDVFKEPIVEIGSDLLPPKFRGDRRTLRDTVMKVAEVINAMGEASATAQGLPRTITTADKLRNSNDQKIHFLLDEKANNGNGAVIGMLKTGHKGLYLFDRSGNNYQISPPCVLDFYIHEKYQRKGLGKELFQHMLQRKAIQPDQMALDRPSEKFLKFLNKHYSLETPMKQMNNYVVFDGFFRQSSGENVPEKKCVLITKGSANGLQSTPSPYKRTAQNQMQNPEVMTESPAPDEAKHPAGEQSFANTQSPQCPMQNQTVSQSDPGIPYRGVQYDQIANSNQQYQENVPNYVQQTARSEPQVCYQPQNMTDYNQIGSETPNNYQLPTSQANPNPNSDLYMYIYLPNQTLSKQDLRQNQTPGMYQPQPGQNQFQANELNANHYQQVQGSTLPQTNFGSMHVINSQDANQNYTPQMVNNTNYQLAAETNAYSQQGYVDTPQQPNEAQQQAPYPVQNIIPQQPSNPASNVHILIQQPSNQQIQTQQPVVAYQQPTTPQPVPYQQTVPYNALNQRGLPLIPQPPMYQGSVQQSMPYQQPPVQQPIQSQSQTYQMPNQQPTAYQMENQQQQRLQQTQSQQLLQQNPQMQTKHPSSHQPPANQQQAQNPQQASYQTQSQPVLSNRPQIQPTTTPSHYQLDQNFMANRAVSQDGMKMSQKNVQSSQHESNVQIHQERNVAGGDWNGQSEGNIQEMKSMEKIIEDKLQQFGYPPQSVPFKPRVLHRTEYRP